MNRFYARVVSALLASLFIFPTVFAKQHGIPQFADYPAGPVFDGRPTNLEWPPYYPQYDFFRISIQSLIQSGANFAGHYAVREWSCGTDCRWLVILDLKTGRFLQNPPYGALSIGYEAPAAGSNHDWLQVRPSSRLLIASGCFDVESDDKPVECGTKFFELREEKFLLLKYVPRPTPQALAQKPTITLSSKLPAQGSLIRVTVKTNVPAATVQGEWGGHKVSFWQDERDKSAFHALLGVDIEQKSGEQKFEVTVTPASGLAEVSEAMVAVRAGHYAIEKLTVAPKFVEPAPEDAERAKKEGEKLRAIYATSSGERLWSGAFRFPLEGPRRGGNFGKRRVLNGEARAPHSGLDVPAPTGAPVHAAGAGRVALAEPLYFAGNAVVIDHGLGLYTFYCHLSEIKVKEGDEVAEGALIGLVGATGRVTGPHLHWGLIVNEAKVNPLQILPVERKAQ